MKTETKKNVATGMSTAAGAVVGAVVGAAVAPNTAEAQEAVVEESTDAKVEAVVEPANEVPVETASPVANAEEQHEVVTKPVVPQEPGPQNPGPVEKPKPEVPVETAENEVEVVGYDRIDNEDGSQMDVAVLNVNGQQVAVVDGNLDGEADIVVCDLNGNGTIEDGEFEIVQGQGIAMQPLQDMAGFHEELAQNDLPDYTNDADVDTFMA